MSPLGCTDKIHATSRKTGTEEGRKTKAIPEAHLTAAKGEGPELRNDAGQEILEEEALRAISQKTAEESTQDEDQGEILPPPEHIGE